ncbi:hypothetical protein BC940DRAFT_69087 [Gongronella butleri]|nr:hypothetical protein BC940DRAFT_69087 [Gongronella butleri]
MLGNERCTRQLFGPLPPYKKVGNDDIFLLDRQGCFHAVSCNAWKPFCIFALTAVLSFVPVCVKKKKKRKKKGTTSAKSNGIERVAPAGPDKLQSMDLRSARAIDFFFFFFSCNCWMPFGYLAFFLDF